MRSLAAVSMNERSGTPSRSGVGTVMIATSNPPRSTGSLVGWNPAASARASSSSAMSSTYDTPVRKESTRSGATSKPTTWKPSSLRPHRERQPDVTLADDRDPRRAGRAAPRARNNASDPVIGSVWQSVSQALTSRAATGRHSSCGIAAPEPERTMTSANAASVPPPDIEVCHGAWQRQPLSVKGRSAAGGARPACAVVMGHDPVRRGEGRERQRSLVAGDGEDGRGLRRHRLQRVRGPARPARGPHRRRGAGAGHRQGAPPRGGPHVRGPNRRGRARVGSGRELRVGARPRRVAAPVGGQLDARPRGGRAVVRDRRARLRRGTARSGARTATRSSTGRFPIRSAIASSGGCPSRSTCARCGWPRIRSSASTTSRRSAARARGIVADAPCWIRGGTTKATACCATRSAPARSAGRWCAPSSARS